ncbi:MAG: winged helix-turn-helix transcriptional regulator [Clostridia bacterium]|nr:winged helix-turn-helix transcriptional regulator [Clostridia bacterium]
MNDSFFQALSNPYRREIIKLLKWKNMNAGEIAEHFQIAQPSVSRHLDVLKKAEIITVERKGTQLIYSLNLSAVQEMFVYMTELFETKDAKGAMGYEPEKC